jgi:hypothetical protein
MLLATRDVEPSEDSHFDPLLLGNPDIGNGNIWVDDFPIKHQFNLFAWGEQ